MKRIILSDLLKSTNTDGILLFNVKGELLESVSINHAKNFAAMSKVVITMAEGIIQNLKSGEFYQLVCKATEGVFVIQRIVNNSFLCAFSKEADKSSLILMSMGSFIKKNGLLD